MLALTDDQMRRVQEAAKPLPYLREAYLKAVAKLLKDQRPITNGVVMRACQQAQAHVLQTYALVPDEDAV
jgi:hypothetical protein